MAGYNLPEVKSAKILHVDELSDWPGDAIHGDRVRVLGRIVSVEAVAHTLHIEYHGVRLCVCTRLLDLDQQQQQQPVMMTIGTLAQFIGEYQRTPPMLRATLVQNMAGIDTDTYDRCLRIRRDFEHKLLNINGTNASR